MKGKTIKHNPILSLLLILALVLSVSIVPVLVPATPVMAASGIVHIVWPTSSNITYAQQATAVTVCYTLTGTDNTTDDTVYIYIKNAASGTVGTAGPLTKTHPTAPWTDTIYTDDVIIFLVSEASYDVWITVNGVVVDDTETGAVVIDNTAPTVTSVAPSGGQYFKGGSSQTISWYVTDACPSNVTIAVQETYNNGTLWTTIDAAGGSYAPGTGTHTSAWVGSTDSTACKVQVMATDAAGNASSYVQSAATFTVLTTPADVSLLVPSDAGITWYGGTPEDITFRGYNTNSPSLSYKFGYSTDDGTSWSDNYTVSSTVKDTDLTEEWMVPYVRSTTCKIRMFATDLAGNDGQATSASNFTIADNLPPTVTVSSPAGGETWYEGTGGTIEWNATDLVAGNLNTTLHYSTDNVTWSNIAALGGLTQGDQTHAWTATGLDGDYYIRVTAVDLASTPNTGYGYSGLFTITDDDTDPTCSITSPTSSSSWPAGTCHDITWTADDETSTTLSILIQYIQGGTQPITTLRGVATGSGSYTWPVPLGAIGNDTQVKLTVTDESSNSYAVTSSAFTVSDNTTPIDTETITLAVGWNLVSLDLLPASTCTAIESVLGDCIPNVLSVWGYSGGTSGTWSSYTPGGPPGLTTMEGGKAYWINMDAGDSWDFQGVKCETGPGSTPPIYSYVAGWNLVGFKSTIAKTVTTYLGGSGYNTPIYEYNTTTDMYDSKNGGDDMTAGKGYWVYFTTATDVSPGCD